MTLLNLIRCDRCAALANKEQSCWMRVRHTNEPDRLGHRFDLCQVCEKAFIDWISNTKEESK